ncbi:MAG: SDR family NAD(P)-dependent oxidoreductase [Nitrospirae bacterium]|nr:SDR family NAD(P)-dependent oxidoreductase [Nitrospirota bacterium]
MRALITGGAGFIGSHLAEELLKEGNKVTVVDDLSTGRRENISHLRENSRFCFVQDTIMNKEKMRELIDDCEVIYHLAAAVGVKFIIDYPLKSMEINVRGTEIVLELAGREKKKVLLTSTSEIYGKKEDGLFKEDDDRVLGATTISRWSYSCTKALDEFLALAYHRKRGLPVAIVRLFNTCGPRQTGRYGMVIPRLVKQALSGKPLTVYGDGKQTRSFTYVTDVIKAIVSLTNHPKAVGEIFNLGSEEGISIYGLAEKIKELTHSQSEIVFVPYEKAYENNFEDMRHRVPDISKIRNLIGYSPRVRLDEMLKRIIESKKEAQRHKGTEAQS